MSWAKTFHDDYLVQTLLRRRDPAQTNRTLNFLESALGLDAGGPVLDQCCGIGSLSIPFAHRGYSVVGVDFTPEYIQRARQEAPAGLEVEFTCADAGQFVHMGCQGAFNWWTGFGYAEDDTENEMLVKSAYESLVSGGRYLLDLMNPAGVLRAFKPTMRTLHPTPEGDIHLSRHTELDWAQGRMNKVWIYERDGAVLQRHQSSVRFYQPHEVHSMFVRAGFTDIQLVGDLEMTPLDIDHVRCIIIGTRP